MRIDRTMPVPGPAATPSWDNSALRSRLEERPEPGATIADLHEIARDRDVTVKIRTRSSRKLLRR